MNLNSSMVDCKGTNRWIWFPPLHLDSQCAFYTRKQHETGLKDSNGSLLHPLPVQYQLGWVSRKASTLPDRLTGFAGRRPYLSLGSDNASGTR